MAVYLHDDTYQATASNIFLILSPFISLRQLPGTNVQFVAAK
jgi:hypothetical protein